MLSRLDLPLAMDDDASVVVAGAVADFDPAYRLMSVRLPGSTACLRMVHGALPTGHPARLAIKARDVSVALERPQGSSIVNVIPVRVLDMAPADNPDHILVRRSEEHTSELQSLMRISYAVFCLQKKKK